MLNKLLIYVIIFLSFCLFVVGVFVYTRGVKIKSLDAEVSRLKVQEVLLNEAHKVNVFETRQSIEFKKEKEIVDEAVSSDIGFHTIVFD